MTVAGAILRPVSFILDPVPRRDRALRAEVARIAADPADRAEKASIARQLAALEVDADDWSGFDVVRCSPTPAPPYDWRTKHEWPVDGHGLHRWTV